jgi:hypothetical protein
MQIRIVTDFFWLRERQTVLLGVTLHRGDLDFHAATAGSIRLR